jgi:hypothetical protein
MGEKESRKQKAEVRGQRAGDSEMAKAETRKQKPENKDEFRLSAF